MFGCSWPTEVELGKVEVVLTQPHRLSPKAVRRRKRVLVRPPQMDQALGSLTTPEDDKEVIHFIKRVAGLTHNISQILGKACRMKLIMSLLFQKHCITVNCLKLYLF